MMRFFPNLTNGDVDPAAWARAREAEGWPGVRVSDHLWLSSPFPHLWVTLTEMAMVTDRVELGSSFANNLFRSPVEFAQAAMSLQRASGGRFEAGLGAGWTADEMTRTGRVYPDPPTRAGMYHEAVQIVRELLQTGRCTFNGNYYDVDIPALGPLGEPPPLAVSVGGPRTIREVAPLADRVEVKANSPATRGGSLDMTTLAEIPHSHLGDLVERVRRANPDAPIGFFAMVAAGDGPAVDQLKAMLGDQLFSALCGAPTAVAEALVALEDLGITRVQLTEMATGTIEALAPHLAHLR